MRKFIALVRLNFRAMLAAFSFGGNKKRAAGGIGTLLLMAGLALYMSGVYSFMLGEMLVQVNLVRFLMPLMALLACLMSLTFTLFAASGIVFGGKDSDIMLSLPVSAFSVMLSKMLALYLENLVFCGMWMLPTAAAYFMYGGALGAGYFITMLIVIFFLPLLPALLGVIAGYIMAYVSSHMARKSLISNILCCTLFLLVMAGSLQINNLAALLLQNQEAVTRTLYSWLLPLGLLMSAVEGSVLSLLGFCAFCLLPFLAVVYLFSTQYKKILTGLASHITRNDYKLQELKAQSQFSALLKKEAGRYFGTTIYLFNTGVGAVMLILFSIYLAFTRAKVLPILAQLGGIEQLMPMATLFLCLLLGTVCTTAVSISLEGKTLWILKEAPIPAATLFGAKIALNLLIAWPTAIFTILVLALSFGAPLLQSAAVLLLCLCLSLFVALSGLMVNLWLPKMDCDNDTIVVKQSASAAVGIFGGMLLTGAGALLYMLVGNLLGLTAFCAACAALLALGCAGCWIYLKGPGARRLISL